VAGFHALRHSNIKALMKSPTSVNVVQTLALPDPDESEAMAATGNRVAKQEWVANGGRNGGEAVDLRQF